MYLFIDNLNLTNRVHTLQYLILSLRRYDATAHAVDFLFDNCSETYWQSAAGVTPVTIQLQLDTYVNLSKIFISFESELPLSAKLEYRHDSQWVPLQYWADDCNASFTLQNNGT